MARVDSSGDSKVSPPEPEVEVAQYARAAGRGRPPAKAFVSKPFSARSLTAAGAKPAQGTLLERLHGKGPVVRWPAGKPGAGKLSAGRPGPAKPGTDTSDSGKPRESSRDNSSTLPSLLASRLASSLAATTAAAERSAPDTTGGNMSERFIAERLLSDRGTSNFNPQIPRRVPDIPSPASIKASEADSDGKRLMIGKQVSLSGEIGGCERLVIEGKVDVTLKDVKTLEVGAQGIFKGTAVVETAVIAGTFEGTLRVSGHLDVGPGAIVKGTVSYGSIAVANGGKLLGTVESSETPAS